MGKIETTLKSEIARLARREARVMLEPLEKKVRELKQQVRSLNGEIGRLSKQAGRSPRVKQIPTAKPETAETDVKKARISPGLIKKLRKRLAITQRELAALVGVSGPAVQSWEQGNARPRGENLAALVALRGVSPAAAAQQLADKGVQASQRRPRV